MSRTLQDQFIDDDEEETCPLCVEELDLSDRGFRPCPCGYQICQFCYHNVRNNMNGLCPACRRPYDDANIVFNKPSTEEEMAWKARQAAKQKKNTIAAQKEAQKREADTLSRKHLAGLRVVQKNLVYVTGLSPSVQEDDLLETLRGPNYFGQYGKIVKIVVSKAKEPHTQSVGVYVTYARKQDAAQCIQAVDGTQNVDRVLRAQFGTTKYCSAYLRNEQCTNRNCMFLHEPGEDNESFTRQDLSSMNVVSTQQPSDSVGSPPQPPPQVAPVAAAHNAIRHEATDAPQSPIDPDRPALPSTASWASKAPQMSRQVSSAGRSTSGAYPSPIVAAATPRKVEKVEKIEKVEAKRDPTPEPVPEPAPAEPAQPPAPREKKQPLASVQLDEIFKSFSPPDFKFVFSTNGLSEDEVESIKNFPSLFDENGGAKRRALRLREEEERRRLEQEAQMAMQSAAAAEPEDNEHEEARGSLQLGGEPEERPDASQQHIIQPPAGISDNFAISNDMSNLNISRGLTPQQHQQLLLQQLKTPSVQGQQQSFQNQLQSSNAPGHARNVSRYTFANDSSSASASVKPVANSKLMNQQTSMMPPQGSLPHQPPTGFFSSNVQGPPPGLKTTGTPPFSGGGMFGQGHGFATSGLGYGANLTGRSPNDEMMRDLLRTRNIGGGVASQVSSDAGKQHPDFHLTGLGLPAHFSPDLMHDSRVSTPPVPPGFEGVRTPGLEGLGQAISHSGLNSPVLGLTGLGLNLDTPRRATPTIPPGFTAEHLSRPPSRTSSVTGISVAKDKERVLPAVPILPGSHTPARAGTPLREVIKVREREEHATPTKAGKRGKGKRLDLDAGVESEGMKNATEDDAIAGAASTEPEAKAVPLEQEKQDVLPGQQSRKSSEAPSPASRPMSAAQMLAEKHARSQQAQAASQQSQSAQQPQPPLTAAQILEQRHRHAEAERAGSRPGSRAQSPVGSRTASPGPVKDSKKKQHPGKLDIAAAVAKPLEASSGTGTPAPSSTTLGKPGAVIKTLPMPLSAAPSRAGTPVTGATDTPVKKATAPRTLRVVATPTPKTETPPLLPAATGTPAGDKAIPAKSALPQLPSRQPSLASINIPGTPNSDHAHSFSISDNVSVTSTSFSRASSPPPVGSRVGSAPVRAKTKNQQKKDRQERARQIEEEKLLAAEAESGGPAKDDGIVQEAIMGRKRKSKKPAAPKSRVKDESRAGTPKLESQQGTPAQSRPGTPKIPAPEAPPSPAITAPVESPKEQTPEPEPEPEPQPEPEPIVSESPLPKSPPPPPAPVLTPQTIINELRQHSPLLSSSIDTLLRPLAQQSQHYKASQALTAHDLSIPRSLERNPDVNIKAVNLEYMWQHNSGLRYGGEDGRVWSRGCVTPGGAHLRHLEESLEERFIALENELRKSPEVLRYWPELQGRAHETVAQLLASVSTSINNTSGPNGTTGRLEDEFPRIDLIRLKKLLEEYERYGGRRDANAMEKAVEEGSKKGSFLVDTAGKYVNEFVLPTYGAPGAGVGNGSGVGGGGNPPVGVGAGGVGATSAVAKLGPGAAPASHVDGQHLDGGAVQDIRVGLSVAEAERLLNESKKVQEEKEAQLRKMVKKNRKLVGLTH